MLPLQVWPASELQSFLEKRVEWHDANISKFVEKWQAYVEPAGGGRAEASKAPRQTGPDNTLPE